MSEPVTPIREPVPELGAPEEKVRGVYAKIAAVMKAVPSVEKKGRNKFHNYDYATESDIVAALRPIMADVGLVCIPTQGERIEAERTTSRGNKTMVVRIQHRFAFIDADDGSSVEVTVYGEGEDAMDKASYKAFTGAQKYALMKTFLLSTGDDPERDHGPPARQASGQTPPGDGPATKKQVAFLTKLMQSSTFTDEEREKTKAEIEKGMSKSIAKRAIDRAQERIAERDALRDAEKDVGEGDGGAGERTDQGTEPEDPAGPAPSDEKPELFERNPNNAAALKERKRLTATEMKDEALLAVADFCDKHGWDKSWAREVSERLFGTPELATLTVEQIHDVHAGLQARLAEEGPS